jgi:hypothetical protein
MSSTRDIVDCLIHFSLPPAAISEADSDDLHDFDDSDSETDVDSDSEAQYITIPPGSPWWKAPPTSSRGISLVGEDDFSDDGTSSSHSLSEILDQQQILVGVFHNELQRMIPGEHRYDDDDWLKEVDAKLLLAPIESFEETCRGTMIPVSRHMATGFGCKPPPDVPLDFDEVEEDDDESTEGWDWVCTVPCYQTNYS